MHMDEPLNEEFTLMDVAYIYRWRRVNVRRILLYVLGCGDLGAIGFFYQKELWFDTGCISCVSFCFPLHCKLLPLASGYPAHFLGIKWPGHEADHLLCLLPRLRMWSSTSTPPICIHGMVLH
jgi:hypothetical protein